jgi:hypothetical protein
MNSSCAANLEGSLGTPSASGRASSTGTSPTSTSPSQPSFASDVGRSSGVSCPATGRVLARSIDRPIAGIAMLPRRAVARTAERCETRSFIGLLLLSAVKAGD